MHFTSTHEILQFPGVQIHGVANTSVFDELQINDGVKALKTAESFVGEIFKLRGVSENELAGMMHGWTGKP